MGDKSSVIHGYAGVVGQLIGTTITHPIDVIRTRLQSSQGRKSIRLTIHDLSKVPLKLGFYRGLTVTLSGSAPARGCWLFWYNYAKNNVVNINNSHLNVALSSLFATTVTTIMFNPFWVIKTRLQLDSSATLNNKNVITSIYRNEGISAFYHGLGAGILGRTLENGLFFVIYEYLKHRMIQYKHNGFAFELLFLAGFSKLLASLISYPTQVITTRLREAPREGTKQYPNIFSCIKKIYKEEGVRAFHRGMLSHICKVVPQQAILIFTYETIVKMM